jgi:2-polyprenyl-6-methoxyphenol hydroxylase-like FAD-dependent oxidoreductase
MVPRRRRARLAAASRPPDLDRLVGALPRLEEIAGARTRALARRVGEAGGAALGQLRLASRVATFPLRQVSVERIVAPGVALVGDAAHAVHPLAGPGRQPRLPGRGRPRTELGRRSPIERPGDLRVLRRYARARREDVAAMQFVTDGLDRLFASRAAGVAWLRNAGLALVDRQPA